MCVFSFKCTLYGFFHAVGRGTDRLVCECKIVTLKTIPSYLAGTSPWARSQNWVRKSYFGGYVLLYNANGRFGLYIVLKEIKI